jgi:3-oxoacyl-ACP reductase-like protein
MKNNTTNDLAMDLITATLDESFVDANDKLHSLIAIKAKSALDDMKESIASDLMDVVKKKVK